MTQVHSPQFPALQIPPWNYFWYSIQYLPPKLSGQKQWQHYILLQCICQAEPNCFSQWPLNLSVCLHRFLWATPAHHSSSLQQPEKVSPNSVKGNHINIKKTEGLIRTDIWYYGICESIYELCDIWYQNQEAITILWGKIINPSNALPLRV